MLKPTDAYSIILRNEDAARRLEASAQTSDWIVRELLRGATIPPAVLIRAETQHAEASRATAGALLLTSTLLCAPFRPSTTLPWWRRLYNRWKSSR